MGTRIILIFGLINAGLFSMLLPLWEGFDEAFHFGYVESLWQHRSLPVLGRTRVPGDVEESFRFAPVSHVIHRMLPQATTFDEWFRLAEVEKERRRRELDQLLPDKAPSSRPNYEAHQPPLAYLLLAPFDWALGHEPITARVLVLRMVGAVAGTVLIYLGVTALCASLLLPGAFAEAVLFTVFCSEMLYATIAHVANDWLAVGLSVCFLAALTRVVRKADGRNLAILAGCLAAGLLTKAYFLVWLVMGAAVLGGMLWRRRLQIRPVIAAAAVVAAAAGPWYARNVWLYGNLSGTHEEFDGIGVKQALAAVPRMDWGATASYLARASLWTGNNSFNNFSRGTLDVILALLVLGFALWAGHRRKIRPVEWMLLLAIVWFSIAVAYAACASFADRHGQTLGASPWYTQALLAPVVALAYCGFSRCKRLGRWWAAMLVALFVWVLVATWVVKLLPIYGGAGSAPARVRGIFRWYAHGAAAHAADLSLTALASAPWVYGVAIASVLLGTAAAAMVIRNLIARSGTLE